MIIAPGGSSSVEFGKRWIIRYFGAEDASLFISDLLAGAGVSIVEAPHEVYTIANTRVYGAGAGINITGIDPSFTISTLGMWAGDYRFSNYLAPYSFVGGVAGAWTDVNAAGGVTSYGLVPGFQVSGLNGIQFAGVTPPGRIFKVAFSMFWVQTWGGQDNMRIRIIKNGVTFIPGEYQMSLITPFVGLCGAVFGQAYVALNTNDILSLQIVCDTAPNITMDITELVLTVESLLL
jgi:hypothetical protein